jgi:hypothetical protein
MKREITLSYLEKFKESPSRTIARMLNRDYPEFFQSIEQARTNVRIYKGVSGNKMRDEVRLTKYYKNAQLA